MSDLEDRVRAAVREEAGAVQVPAGLRGRVLARAAQPVPVRRQWVTAAGLAAIALVVAGSVGLYQATRRPAAPAMAFGRLPPAALHPPQGLGGGPQGAVKLSAYFGPAHLSWAGQLPAVPSTAPVVRYRLPDAAAERAFARRLHATARPDGSYALPGGYSLYLQQSPLLQAPNFLILPNAAAQGFRAPGAATPETQAAAALARYGLTPTWKYALRLTAPEAPPGEPPTFKVVYQRLFDLGGGRMAGLVDGAGDPSGVSVFLDATGRLVEISGLLPATEMSSAYPLGGGPAVARAALSAPPAIPVGLEPTPTVVLTRALLVYTQALSRDSAYFEPAYLFTGDFSDNGSFEKRVLVAAAKS